MYCATTPNMAGLLCSQMCKFTVNFIGSPGIGKTFTLAAYAKALNRDFLPFIGSQQEPQDIGGFPTQSEDDLGKYIEMIPMKRFRALAKGEWVLLMDELTGLPRPIQAPMLGMLDHRQIGDYKLPKSLVMVAACNPPSEAVDGSPLPPPMANRMMHLPWEYDDDAWIKGMLNSGNFPEPIFPTLPADWERYLAESFAHVAAFHKHKPGVLHPGVPDDVDKAAGPYPSNRSWTNAAYADAACASVNAEPAIRYQAIRGLVGAVGDEYAEWRRNLDLPDPDEAIAKVIAWMGKEKKGEIPAKMPDRSDKVLAFLSSVIHRATQFERDKSGKPSEIRWLAAVEIVNSGMLEWREASSCAAESLFSPAVIPGGAALVKVPAEFAETCLPMYERVMSAIEEGGK